MYLLTISLAITSATLVSVFFKAKPYAESSIECDEDALEEYYRRDFKNY